MMLSATAVMSSGKTCSFMPNEPPMSGAITRTRDSFSPKWRA